MKLSIHAIRRLAERHNIGLQHELKAILFLLDLKQYRIIKQESERKSWTLSIRFNSKCINLVLNPFTKEVITALS